MAKKPESPGESAHHREGTSTLHTHNNGGIQTPGGWEATVPPTELPCHRGPYRYLKGPIQK